MSSTALIIVILILCITNINAFVFMARDKKKAEKGVRRTPEKTLFLMTALFGGLGGTLGMVVMHHKTKHWYFALFFPLMMIAQILILIYLYMLLA